MGAAACQSHKADEECSFHEAEANRPELSAQTGGKPTLRSFSRPLAASCQAAY